MANKTTNFGLTKPLPEDFYNVDVQNENMDIIDTVLMDRAIAPFAALLTGNYKDGYQIDKTFDDILTAYAEGREMCIFDASSSMRVFRFVKAYGSSAYFAYNNGEEAVSIAVNRNNIVTVTSLSFLKENHTQDVNAHRDIRELLSIATTTADSAKSDAENALNKVNAAVPRTRKVNNKELSSDISLTASDVGAASTSHKHTKSEITDFPTGLKCPNALILNGSEYDGSEVKDFTNAVESLIDQKLGVIENGTY